MSRAIISATLSPFFSAMTRRATANPCAILLGKSVREEMKLSSTGLARGVVVTGGPLLEVPGVAESAILRFRAAFTGVECENNVGDVC